MGRARRARKIAATAAYGGGGVGGASVLRWGLRAGASSRPRPPWRDASSAPRSTTPPTTTASTAPGRGEPYDIVVLGDSSAAGMGAEAPHETVGAIVASGVAAAHRPAGAPDQPGRRRCRVQRPRAPARQRARGGPAARRRAHHGRRQRRDPPDRAHRRRSASSSRPCGGSARWARRSSSAPVPTSAPSSRSASRCAPWCSAGRATSRPPRPSPSSRPAAAPCRSVTCSGPSSRSRRTRCSARTASTRRRPATRGRRRLLPSVCAALGVWGADTTDRAAGAAPRRGRRPGRRRGGAGRQGARHRGVADPDRRPVAWAARPVGGHPAAPARRRPAGGGHPGRDRGRGRAGRRARRRDAGGAGLSAPSGLCAPGKPSPSHRNRCGAKVKVPASGGKVGTTRRRWPRARPRPSSGGRPARRRRPSCSRGGSAEDLAVHRRHRVDHLGVAVGDVVARPDDVLRAPAELGERREGDLPAATRLRGGVDADVTVGVDRRGARDRDVPADADGAGEPHAGLVRRP